jgi:hypothetical protein
MTMPSNTTVIDRVFGGEAQYRILSATAHSLPYAMSQLAQRQSGADAVRRIPRTAYHNDLVLLEPHMTAGSLAVLCHWVALAVAKPIWYHTRLFGIEEAEMADIIDDGTGNHVAHQHRFWRSG